MEEESSKSEIILDGERFKWFKYLGYMLMLNEFNGWNRIVVKVESCEG